MESLIKNGKKSVHINLYTVRYKFLLQQGLKINYEKRGTSKNDITFLAIKKRERFQCYRYFKDSSVGKNELERWHYKNGKCLKDDSVGKESVRKMTVLEKKVFER